MVKLMRSAAIAACIGYLATCAAARGDLAIVEVSPGLYRGPAPASGGDYRQLRDLGVRTVLDLRKFRVGRMNNTCRCARAHGMNYVRSPVAFRPRRDGSAERALRVVADPRRRPLYIHCEYGRDRAGLVIALYRVRCEGWSRQAAYCEMKRLGFSDFLRGLEKYFWAYAKHR